MKQVWNEQSIREVIKKLDDRTGLNGAALPIRFGKAATILGAYNQSKGGSFIFSDVWFGNENWPYESAIEVIKHEYAHYMDHVIFRGSGHGKSWKKCCSDIGVPAIRLYTDERSSYYRDKHQEEKELEKKLGGYMRGQRITHPVYGQGTIKVIRKSGSSVVAEIEFKAYGIKTVDLAWYENNVAAKSKTGQNIYT